MLMLADGIVVERIAATGHIADRTVVYLAYLVGAVCPKHSFADASTVTATASWPSAGAFGLHLGVGLLVPLGPSCSNRAQPPDHTTHHSHPAYLGLAPWAKGCPLKPSWPASGVLFSAISSAI